MYTEELSLNLETDGPQEISELIQKIIQSAYENKDDPELYSQSCEAMGNMVLFLIRHDRFVFGLKEKKNEQEEILPIHLN